MLYEQIGIQSALEDGCSKVDFFFWFRFLNSSAIALRSSGFSPNKASVLLVTYATP